MVPLAWMRCSRMGANRRRKLKFDELAMERSEAEAGVGWRASLLAAGTAGVGGSRRIRFAKAGEGQLCLFDS